MQRQLADNPVKPPRVIGKDEISVRKGHEYRIIVHDLERRRPIWFGGEDRTIKSMDLFYEALGIEACEKIELGVMDMWRAFEQSFQAHCPNGKIAYDPLPRVQAPECRNRRNQEGGVQADRRG